MNIFTFILLLLIACGNNTTYSMMLAHKQEHYRKTTNLCIKEKDHAFKKPISVCIYPHVESQNTMTTLGTLPVALAQKKAHELTSEYFSYYFEQQYDDQKDSNQSEMIKILSLPVEVVHPICFHICNKNIFMFDAFCQQPLGKALEWLALTKEKYEKDKKLKNLISFPQFYVFSKEMIIELANTTHYFAHNKTNDYPISLYQEKILSCLPRTLKNDPYFSNKIFENKTKALYKMYKSYLPLITKVNFSVMLPGFIAIDYLSEYPTQSLVNILNGNFSRMAKYLLFYELAAPPAIYFYQSDETKKQFAQSTIHQLGKW